VLWERANPPDASNRILLGMNCLLIEGPGCRILVDTGVGDKEDDVFADMFALERTATLMDELAARGLKPEDITHVVNTHLHFDHCGGNTRLDAGGLAVPAYPRARYIVQRSEWEDALAPDPRSRASYLERNFAPVAEAGQLDLVEGEVEIAPGVRLLPSPGHTRGHQSVLVQTQAGAVFYAADLIPTSSHLPLPWLMSYDLYPIQTVETKRRFLERQREEGWLLFFEHEPERPYGRLVWQPAKQGERPVFEPLPLDEAPKAPA
jgi:glyoxylase-like metal-dependent hydrolase (beta-lactamase superfamily II)